jgi:hypothetical protein
LSNDLEVLLSSPPFLSNIKMPVIVVAGDFNSLNGEFLECDFGLVQVVNKPTIIVFRQIFRSRPDVSQIEVFSCLIKTKHRAVYDNQYVGPGRRCAKASLQEIVGV